MKTGSRILITIFWILQFGVVADGVQKSYAIKAGKILTMSLTKNSDVSRSVISARA